MNTNLVPALVLTLFVGIQQVAEAAPPGVERADSRQSRRAVQDDKRDRNVLAAHVAAWKQAVAKRDRAQEKAADVGINAWIQRELEEERREDRQSHREQNRSRRELRRTRNTRGASPGTRKDRRDVRDDRRDAQREQNETKRLVAMATQLREMQPRFATGTASPADYAEKRKLLEAMLVAEAREVQTSKAERGEDRRERREIR
ncbi:MAG: hypothetical protein AAFU79_09525 [Myxococcota bacterium]